MTDRPLAGTRRRLHHGACAAALTTVSAVVAITGTAQATPAPSAAREASWTVDFGSIGPVTTSMTAAQAIRRLHSHASSKATSPYCGLFGLTGNAPTGLVGFAPRKNGRLGMLSVGSVFGGSRKGLPKVVQTSRGIRIGTSLAKLKAAYPHRLRKTTNYGNTVEVLAGPKGLAIAFEITKGKVVNIETGTAKLLSRSEYCG